MEKNCQETYNSREDKDQAADLSKEHVDVE